MNTSHLPGFTGEASFPARSKDYRTLRIPPVHASGSAVVPQFCYTNLEGNVTECCYCYQGDCWCLPRTDVLDFSPSDMT
jgi:hypothetical protein